MSTLKITIRDEDGEDLTLPGKYGVCGTCEGRGVHVNPAIDGNGLSSEDFDEDPDFAEDYFSGAYDVRCNECGGDRVVVELDGDRCTARQLSLYERHCDAKWADAAEAAAERRWGY